MAFPKDYNTSWERPSQYFTTIDQINRSKLMLCEETLLMSVKMMSTYLEITGDHEGVSQGGAIGGRCYIHRCQRKNFCVFGVKLKNRSEGNYCFRCAGLRRYRPCFLMFFDVFLFNLLDCISCLCSRAGASWVIYMVEIVVISLSFDLSLSAEPTGMKIETRPQQVSKTGGPSKLHAKHMDGSLWINNGFLVWALFTEYSMVSHLQVVYLSPLG